MVPPVGIEPTTRRFSVSCSTNWATEANFSLKEKWRPEGGSNPWPLAWQASALTNWATGPYGGNNRARTYDPLLVRQMLSQLSYASIVLSHLTALILYQTLICLSIHFLIFLKIFFRILLWINYRKISHIIKSFLYKKTKSLMEYHKRQKCHERTIDLIVWFLNRLF